ncbi:MAG: hypothetical protein ACP5HW_01450 [Candidatus Micrarchaeia archaeon]
MKSYCIICGKERNGIEVDEDFVIKSVRWFKRNVTKNEEGNKLVVCSECYPKYLKYRRRFVEREIVYLTLGFLFLIFGLIVSFRLSTLIIGLLLMLFLYFLSLLSYMPRLKEDRSKRNGQG